MYVRRRNGPRAPAVLALVSALTLIVPLGGCIDAPDGDDTEGLALTLSAPVLDGRTVDQESVWDVTLTVVGVANLTATPRWVELSVVVTSVTGTELLPGTPLSRDEGLYGYTVEVWYRDDGGSGDIADIADAIRVTSMTQGYQGATVDVMWRGSVVASAALPSIFT